MAEPYVKKDPGDLIRANDWNDMQSKARDEILGHRHAGDGQGVQLMGDAIHPTAELRVKSVTADTFSVAGADLSAELKTLLNGVHAALPLAGGTMTGELIAAGGLRLPYDVNIWLRDSDKNHGLGYCGGTKVFAGKALDGPVLHGYNGGGLGSKDGAESRLALTWDGQGTVTALNDLTVTKKLTVSNVLVANGDIRMDNKTLWLRPGDDVHHGLGFYGNNYKFGDQEPDGPVLFGNSGGGLGSTKENAKKLALTWDWDQNVAINKNLTVAGRVTAMGSRRDIWRSTARMDSSARDWENIRDMSQSFTATGGMMLFIFKTGGVQTINIGDVRVKFQMTLDDVPLTSCMQEFHNKGWELRDVSLLALVNVKAGARNLKIQWRIFQNSGETIPAGATMVCSMYDSERVLMAIDL
jgi:hypothetical protein